MVSISKYHISYNAIQIVQCASYVCIFFFGIPQNRIAGKVKIANGLIQRTGCRG